jgi:hypothetical protein
LSKARIRIFFGRTVEGSGAWVNRRYYFSRLWLVPTILQFIFSWWASPCTSIEKERGLNVRGVLLPVFIPFPLSAMNRFRLYYNFYGELNSDSAVWSICLNCLIFFYCYYYYYYYYWSLSFNWVGDVYFLF